MDYTDYEKVIKKFWECNIKQNYRGFSFIKVFESFEGLIYGKLAEHGFLTLKDFKQIQREVFNFDCLEELQQITEYIRIDTEDLRNAVIEYKYNRFKEEFNDYIKLIDLKRVYDKIQKAKAGILNNKEMVCLFDEIIHTEHETGLIFEDYFCLDDLKKEFERDFKK